MPYYAGARIVVYRKDLFEAAGIEIPTTLDEFLAAGAALKADNAATPNFSGIYLPGKNWYAVLSYIWDKGGDIATQEDGEWVGQLDSPESVAGLEYFKQVFDEANAAPADSDDAQDFTAFCNGEVGMMPAPGWKPGQIINPEDGCPDMEPNIGVFALPGIGGRHDGARLPRRLGARHPDQQRAPGPGLRPAQDPGLGRLPAEDGRGRADPGAQVGARARSPAATPPSPRPTAAENSRFVPTSEKWAGRRGGQRAARHARADRPGHADRRSRRRRPTRRSKPTLNG